MDINDRRVESAIEAYDWVRLTTFTPSIVGHAVMERFENHGVVRTLCGHMRVADIEAEAVQRCGTCLSVIYAKLGVRGIAT